MKSKKKNIYKLHLRSYGIGLLLLSSISLLSFGFSSWYFGIGGSIFANVNVSVGDVVKLDDVFLIQEPKMFTYNQYGILQDETFVSEGYVYFPIIVDTTTENYSLIKQDSESLNLTLSIESTGTINVFSDDYFKSISEVSNPISYSLSNSDFSDSFIFTPTYSKIDNLVCLPVTITESCLNNDKIYINVRSHFIFDDFSSVYQKISSNNGLSFSISVGVY